MFYEDWVLDKELCDDADHRAHYNPDDLMITYYLPFMMEGIMDICTTVTHEWIHGLIDWAMLGPNGEYTAEWLDKYKHDEEGDLDHFIIRLINYD